MLKVSYLIITLWISLGKRECVYPTMYIIRLLGRFDHFSLLICYYCSLMPLIIKIILIPLTLSLTLAAEKTQYFVHLIFNSTLKLINGIVNDLQKLRKYFNGRAIFEFLKTPFAPTATVFSNNLALYLNDLNYHH